MRPASLRPAPVEVVTMCKTVVVPLSPTEASEKLMEARYSYRRTRECLHSLSRTRAYESFLADYDASALEGWRYNVMCDPESNEPYTAFVITGQASQQQITRRTAEGVSPAVSGTMNVDAKMLWTGEPPEGVTVHMLTPDGVGPPPVSPLQEDERVAVFVAVQVLQETLDAVEQAFQRVARLCADPTPEGAHALFAGNGVAIGDSLRAAAGGINLTLAPLLLKWAGLGSHSILTADFVDAFRNAAQAFPEQSDGSPP